MASCAVKWCGKSAKTSSYQKDGITFHRFPKCPERKKMWIDATFRGEQWFPTKNSVLCSRHFTEDNLHIMKNRRRLLDSAIPSLYLPVLAPVPTISAGADIAAKNMEIPVAGTSFKNAIAGSPLKHVNNPPTPKNQSHCLETPTKQKRKLSPICDTPSAFDTPVEKHHCRKIIELTNIVKKKDKKIKKLSDSNRRLKRQILSLKSLLAELQNKNLLTAENNDALSSLRVKCGEIIKTEDSRVNYEIGTSNTSVHPVTMVAVKHSKRRELK